MNRVRAEQLLQIAYRNEDAALDFAIDVLELSDQLRAQGRTVLDLLTDEAVLMLAMFVTDRQLAVARQDAAETAKVAAEIMRRTLTVITGGKSEESRRDAE